MVRDSKSCYGVFGIVLLVLSFPLTAHGETSGPGSATEQTFTVARAVLSATPADVATFAGWGSDCTGTTCELVTDGTKAVTATFRESADAPASALGDSPTVAGMITNLGRADFAGKVLELKAEGFSTRPKDDVFAASPVADDGSFALRLPGEVEMTPRLVDATPELFGDPGCDTTITPESSNLLTPRTSFSTLTAS